MTLSKLEDQKVPYLDHTQQEERDPLSLPPPPYQAAATPQLNLSVGSEFESEPDAAAPAYVVDQNQPRPILRTLKAHYSSVSGGKLIVYETDDSQPVYVADTRTIMKPHMKFRSDGDSRGPVGTATFHMMQPNIDLTVQGDKIHINAHLGPLRTFYFFQSSAILPRADTSQPSLSQRFNWSRNNARPDLFCLDPNGVEIAQLRWRKGGQKRYGEFEIYEPSCVLNGRALDEIVIGGMAQIHLISYMTMSAGSAGGSRYMAGAGGGGA